MLFNVVKITKQCFLETVKSMENPQLQIALNKVRVDIAIRVQDVDLCQQYLFKQQNHFIHRCHLQSHITSASRMPLGLRQHISIIWNSLISMREPQLEPDRLLFA